MIKVHIDVDVEGYRPEQGETDRDGDEIEDRIYNQKDFDRTLVIDDRTKLVAKKVTEFLKESGDRFQKTIVFCVDQEHAARMRQALINENPDLVAAEPAAMSCASPATIPEGQDQLGNFIDPEAKYPVLVTTSRLLSTGVDAQTCRLIVLDRAVGSMTEFKQIVGRGTRVHEDTKKFYFTLIDFRGRPTILPTPISTASRCRFTSRARTIPSRRRMTCRPPTMMKTHSAEPGEDEIDRRCRAARHHHHARRAQDRGRFYVDGVRVTIIAERVEYLDENGKLVTESLRDYSKKALTQALRQP